MYLVGSPWLSTVADIRLTSFCGLILEYLTAHLLPSPFKSQLPVPAGGPSASLPPPLHADTSTLSGTGAGPWGTPRAEGRAAAAGQGSALDLCLEAMGAHGSADPCRGGCEQVLPPPWQVPCQPQPASLLLCSYREEGIGAWPCVLGG